MNSESAASETESSASSAGETIVFAPLPDLVSRAHLPEDASSRAFLEAVRALRSAFERRQDYNAFICTQLAARGVVPNSTLVLDIGAWGSKGDVSADVKAWFSQIVRHSADAQFAVPPALRRPALRLLEQLWALAAQAATEQIEHDRKQSLNAFESQRQELEEMRRRLIEADHNLQALTLQRDSAASLAADLRQQLDRLLQRFEAVQAKADAEVASLRKEAERERQNHRDELQQLRLAHERAMQDLQSNHDARVAALTNGFEQETVALKGRIESLEQSLAQMEREAKVAADQAAQHARMMALTIDRARQDAMAAAERALEAQRRITEVNAKLVEAELRAATLERDLAQERARSAALEQTVKAATEKAEKKAPGSPQSKAAPSSKS